MAYTFFKAQGFLIGNSLVEEDMIDKAKQIIQLCKENNTKLILPEDIVAAKNFSNDAEYRVFDMPPGIDAGYEGMDIGPKTIKKWQEVVQEAKTILWNGPLGVFEFENFAKGTNSLAKSIAYLPECCTIIGGGDSVAAVQKANLADKMSHLSTGGGASLEYLEHLTLPGIEAIN